MKTRVLSISFVLTSALLLMAASDGTWMSRVPEKERAATNPMATDPDAPLAGAKLFQQHCASCHGHDAEGKSKHPGLHSDVVRDAQPGELQWLLTNGSLRRGMPSWSRLPGEQRWQIVTYLKTLK
jgi:mono/diheme cytochrome c family protein